GRLRGAAQGCRSGAGAAHVPGSLRHGADGPGRTRRDRGRHAVHLGCPSFDDGAFRTLSGAVARAFMSALAGVASLFTVLIVASSALIRRWHEGMGCEAWAGCAALFRAEADAVPAAIEIARLAHRVSASTVGVLVALLLLYGWQSFDRGRRAAALAAVGVTLFLASLGRHSSLASAPVTLGNVLGGTVLVFVLGWLASRPSGPLDAPGPASATQGWFVGASALVACLLLAASVASGVALGERHAWL